MTAASRESLGNGTSSVMHSRISIANENVSELVFAVSSPFLRSSGAEYLTKSPDDTVFEIVLSLTSSTIFAIPKSQICGSPLPVCGQPQSVGRMCTWNLPRERQAHFSTHLQLTEIHRVV